MNDETETVEVVEAVPMAETVEITEYQYIELIAGALIEFKMYFVAFFMVYIIFKIVRWDAK